MGYTIEKYYKKKLKNGKYVLKAKVFKRNMFGSITKIFKERLDDNYKCSHEVYYSRFLIRRFGDIYSKKEATIIINTLNNLS